MTTIRELLEVLADAALEQVPEALSRRARAVPMAGGRTWTTFVGRPVEREPALALRGGDAGAHRLLRAGAYQLDIAWLENGALVGQVLPVDGDTPPLGGGTCALMGTERAIVADLDVDGSFRFEAPEDALTLVVESGEVRLVFEDLTE